MDSERQNSLEKQVKQLQVDKLELIRSTSTEIERLRHIIRTLTSSSSDTTQLQQSLDKLQYTPLTAEEKAKVSSSPSAPSLSSAVFASPASGSTASVPPVSGPDVNISEWQTQPPSRTLGSLREEKSYEYNSETQSGPPKVGTHRKEDTWIKLNTKRMSYKGFEFGDFGFMTTDFDQLSRGHTQWVNEVMHHPVQNGIVVTASDDWCVMFWRFKKAIGSDELKQEMRSENTNQLNLDVMAHTDPKLQRIAGEIELVPVLKINTGLEVKALCMSADGTVLAATCYDEEEDEGNPELQLYIDAQQKWMFKQTHFKPYRSGSQNNASQSAPAHSERMISRRIISLPFEPIPHCVCLTRDSKFVFVAMYSSETILAELNEEHCEEMGDDAQSKWPDHPFSLCCVNLRTQHIGECEKIWPLMGADEHVSCMAISPNGAHIALGTSLGQLIVTGVLNLTGDITNDEDYSPLLQRIWSSDEGDDATDSAGSDALPEKSEDVDGSVTAIGWTPDSEWIVVGTASGALKLWQRVKESDAESEKKRRLSTQLNRTINQWMGKAKVMRRSKMFEQRWYLEGRHIEAINSMSIRGSMMVSGADDGNVVLHDLLPLFSEGKEPVVIGQVRRIHGGRMVNSVALTGNYEEENLLLPSTGFFMVTSGADNIVHCVSLLEVCRESIRNNLALQGSSAAGK